MTTDSKRPFRILALDGGGIKGVFSASFLAEVERMTGKQVADYFDLITGTSTGGIIAIGLGLGLPASEILSFYLKHGPTIFPSVGVHVRTWRRSRWLVCGKHDPAPLREALQEVFGDRKLGNSRTRLVIPAFNVLDGSIALFKTAHCDRFKQDYLRRCVDVALATSAAPTYLPAHDIGDGRIYLDGGVWANNPIMVGVIEAIANIGQRPNQIDVLNIGTTDEPFHVPEKLRRRGGAWRWRNKLVPLFMQAQADGAAKQAAILLGRSPYRVNPVVQTARFSIDDVRQISDLKGLGIDRARHEEKTVSLRFLDRAADPFTPCLSIQSQALKSNPA
ncbi:MAG: patatin-like phospholipase family protein [Acidobacteriales bacterium]|nr:patatin-like phospholipase family protein [Terriglobales bacterium]